MCIIEEREWLVEGGNRIVEEEDRRIPMIDQEEWGLAEERKGESQGESEEGGGESDGKGEGVLERERDSIGREEEETGI